METQSFDELFLQHVESLCTDIRRVYHLDRPDAQKALYGTHFYSCLSREETGLWKLESNKLFLLYQDEIEYGKLIPYSQKGV